ncbi:MAG: epoxyqueuosine reductase QueH [Patescibacteria group bacterium]|nr:epoxyqueuosine reductase QueH [Patescibacteria group bacterium]
MTKPRLFLHACCAPCACYPVELLRGEYDITLFFYNPNIYPEEEFNKRLEEIKLFCRRTWPSSPTNHLIVGEYDSRHWFELVKGLENEPERGRRCDICYEMRLRKTAQQAKAESYDYFGTDLSISPHKKADKINELGRQLEKEFSIKYFEADFKKKDGFKKSLEISHQHNFYRQNYCGCVFSRAGREVKKCQHTTTIS